MMAQLSQMAPSSEPFSSRVGQVWQGLMARNSGVRVLPAALTISTLLDASSLRCLTTARGPWELGAGRHGHGATGRDRRSTSATRHKYER